MELSKEQTIKLEEAVRARDAVEQRIKELHDAEESCVATPEVYAAFNALLQTAQLELNRFDCIVFLLGNGKHCSWQR